METACATSGGHVAPRGAGEKDVRLRDFGLLFLLGSIWGASYLFIKVAVAVFPPATLVTGRVLLAGLLSWLILKAQGSGLPRDSRDWTSFAGTGLLNGALPYTLITWGEQFVDTGLAAILIASSPIFTVIFAQFFLPDERLTPPRAAGIVLGFLGVAALVGPDALAGAGDSLLGDLAIVAASASYGAAFIWTRLRMRGVTPMQATTGQLLMATLYILPIALVVDRPWQLDLAPTATTFAAVAALLALAVVGTSLAYVLYYWLVKQVGATQASLVTYISPFTSLVWGALLLGERLTLTAGIGFGLILLGLGLINGWLAPRSQRSANP